MIQAIGLTSKPRRELPPAVDDVSFEAHSGRVTALLGTPGAGKTTALGLMLELQPGRGTAHFRGRPLHRITHPSREVGVLLGDVPGHPSRTVRGHLRMLCAAVGVPVRRADEVLEAVGLVSLRDERLGTLSRGMDRRLGLASALLGDPHALVLDDPAAELSTRESRRLHDLLRVHADQGGTVLFTTADPKEAARTADHVITLHDGRVVADQEAADFARTRLRPRVAVRTPHAPRLATLLAQDARIAQRFLEVTHEGGNRLSVYGGSCAEVGEVAFRHGIVVHQLADEIGDMGPVMDAADAQDTQDTRVPEQLQGGAGQGPDREQGQPHPREGESAPALRSVPAPRTLDSPPPSPSPPPLPPLIAVRPAPTPLRPLHYELRRVTGVATTFGIAAAVLLVSVVTAVVMARIGHTRPTRLLTAWPREVPLPPAALGAGLVGALAFGDEFRHPALAADRGTVPRRLGLLAAKLVVSAVVALVLAVLTVGCDAEVLYLLFGREVVEVSEGRVVWGVAWAGLVVGCAWAGVLAAGVFRSTTAGLATVVTVPVVVVPLVHKLFRGPSVRTASALHARLHEVLLPQWPFGGERYVDGALRVIAQPAGGAMALSLTTLLCVYVFSAVRGRV
ncbi:ABC transporter ATP-binding protein [Streptomyces sp. NPDC005925]|uniref:ABC transporter ATP-binding protein n=1 Tax=Streptomyces sp. NPDC005925 TaxID=3157172 RepID=UPI0033E730E6